MSIKEVLKKFFSNDAIKEKCFNHEPRHTLIEYNGQIWKCINKNFWHSSDATKEYNRIMDQLAKMNNCLISNASGIKLNFPFWIVKIYWRDINKIKF